MSGIKTSMDRFFSPRSIIGRSLTRLLKIPKCSSPRCQSFSCVSKLKQRAEPDTTALTPSEIRSRRNVLFENELQRQKRLLGNRVKKICVKYEGGPYGADMYMNSGESTPHDCALHLEKHLVDRSCLAFVDGLPWDMHRPLISDCSLELRHFNEEDPFHCNRAFWRSCSFVLGMILETTFKESLSSRVRLCSFPSPKLENGSFVYDVDLGDALKDWSPTVEELKCMSAQAGRLHWENLRFERLQVSEPVATDLFAHDDFKLSQIPFIVEKSRQRESVENDGSSPYDAMDTPEGFVTLYRLGDHVDISTGPMIASTRFFQPGRFSVAAVRPISSPSYGRLSRVQGVALPFGVSLHSYSYEKVLLRAAARPNPSPVPTVKGQRPRALAAA